MINEISRLISVIEGDKFHEIENFMRKYVFLKLDMYNKCNEKYLQCISNRDTYMYLHSPKLLGRSIANKQYIYFKDGLRPNRSLALKQFNQ